jgi:hypothetical protein
MIGSKVSTLVELSFSRHEIEAYIEAYIKARLARLPSLKQVSAKELRGCTHSRQLECLHIRSCRDRQGAYGALSSASFRRVQVPLALG